MNLNQIYQRLLNDKYPTNWQFKKQIKHIQITINASVTLFLQIQSHMLVIHDDGQTFNQLSNPLKLSDTKTLWAKNFDLMVNHDVIYAYTDLDHLKHTLMQILDYLTQIGYRDLKQPLVTSKQIWFEQLDQILDKVTMANQIDITSLSPLNEHQTHHAQYRLQQIQQQLKQLNLKLN